MQVIGTLLIYIAVACLGCYQLMLYLKRKKGVGVLQLGVNAIFHLQELIEQEYVFKLKVLYVIGMLGLFGAIIIRCVI
ncbi:hypothetical protein FHS30_000346 [Simiduia aestuariiviva]|uniref:Uncharacterized protein n=1 Tax=Simiduia aestuariiviva TaxID=1510459 RepID=A0A839UKP1_9GAMM|nr:hypothetical protein [Simiduia aestuariiviva]